jgi:hypothetical protein
VTGVLEALKRERRQDFKRRMLDLGLSMEQLHEHVISRRSADSENAPGA